jgi:predicted nucleic acid-binding protein
VRVYVESNFVLELVLEQEQHEACEEILTLAASRDIELALPAFALIEPYESMVRDEREGSQLAQRLRESAVQLARTASMAGDVPRLHDAGDLLVRGAQEAWTRFHDLRTRLLDIAHLLAIDAATIREASQLTMAFGLGLPDAIMLASVLADAVTHPSPSVFVNRNRKDFDIDVKARLAQVRCELLWSFDGGLGRVRHLVSTSRQVG